MPARSCKRWHLTCTVEDTLVRVAMNRDVLRLLVASSVVSSAACAAVVSFDSYSEQREAPQQGSRLYGATGTVEGLDEGGGVALELNGVILQDVRNGPFAFTPFLADGAPWRFSASRGSSNSSCTLSPQTGTVLGADILGLAARCISSDSALAELSFSSGKLEPDFAPVGRRYLLRVKISRFNETMMTLYASARRPGATVSFGAEPLGNAGRSSPILLPAGDSYLFDLTITVTAPDKSVSGYSVQVFGST
jgi:hypothetical protein